MSRETFEPFVNICKAESIQTVLVFGIDFTHHGLYGLAYAAFLAGKENAEAGAGNQSNQTDNNHHNNRNPAPS